MTWRLVWLMLVAVGVPALAGAEPVVAGRPQGGTPTGTLTFVGQHRFRLGDQPEWANPDFDDTDWPHIDVPSDWSRLPNSGGVRLGWYRIRFETPTLAEPGVSLGVIHSADEVFLNGTQIGGEGRIGTDFVEVPRLERVYRLPRELLRADRPNVLTVRVLQTYVPGGIVTGTPRVADYTTLLAERDRRMLPTRLLEAVLWGFFAVMVLGGAAMWLTGIRDAEYVAFGILALSYSLASGIDSQLIYDFGWKSPWCERVFILFSAITTLPGVWYASRVFHRSWPRWLTIWSILTAVSSGLFLIEWPLSWLDPLLAVSIVLASVGMGVMLWWAISGVSHREPEARWVLGGMLLTCGTMLGDFFAITRSWTIAQIPLAHFGWEASLLCLIIGLAARFQRTRLQLRRTSGVILVAHEEERKRLAREIHDGVLQSLLAIKFNIERHRQRVEQGKPIEVSELSELITESQTTVEELRRVSHDLRPEMLEQVSLVEALGCLAQSLSSSSGVAISVTGDNALPTPPKSRDHLYRIAQECLQNILKHAEASRVELQLSQPTSGWLQLRVTDNGRGFDRRHARNGIGLTTITERAELLGGQAIVESHLGHGTTVTIEVPNE